MQRGTGRSGPAASLSVAHRHGGVSLVIVPEIIPAKRWQNLLHNQRALIIQAALLFKPSVIVTAVPYHLER